MKNALFQFINPKSNTQIFNQTFYKCHIISKTIPNTRNKQHLIFFSFFTLVHPNTHTLFSSFYLEGKGSEVGVNERMISGEERKINIMCVFQLYKRKGEVKEKIMKMTILPTCSNGKGQNIIQVFKGQFSQYTWAYIFPLYFHPKIGVKHLLTKTLHFTPISFTFFSMKILENTIKF